MGNISLKHLSSLQVLEIRHCVHGSSQNAARRGASPRREMWTIQATVGLYPEWILTSCENLRGILSPYGRYLERGTPLCQVHTTVQCVFGRFQQGNVVGVFKATLPKFTLWRTTRTMNAVFLRGWTIP